MSEITFKPVQKEHFQMMHDRLKKDHIQWFYDWGEESFAEYSQWMVDRIDNPYQFPYIFLVDDIPVWYIQCYDCYGIAEDVYGELVEKGTWWIDMYIWDENYLWKWFWVLSLKEFVTFVKNNHKATNIVIDPTPDNIRAIWAYKKAGFEPIKEFEIDWNIHLLMIYKNNHENI